MTTDEQNKALDKQVDRALHSGPEIETPAALDAKVLHYAKEHAPAKPGPRYSIWMPATAAVCLTGVALLIALPLSPPPLLEQNDYRVAYDESTVAAQSQSRAMAKTSKPQSSALQELSASRKPLSRNEPFERSQTYKQKKFEPSNDDVVVESPMVEMASASAQSSAMLEEIVIADEVFAPEAQTKARRLDNGESAVAREQQLREPTPITIDADSYAQLRTLSHPIQATTSSNKVLELNKVKESAGSESTGLADSAVAGNYADESVAFAEGERNMPAKLKTKRLDKAEADSKSDERELRYQRLRESCACKLPPNLLQAKEMLERGEIIIAPDNGS